MIPDVISMGGAAWRTSHILSFATRKEWVEYQMKSGTSCWPEKTAEVRKQMFGQVYDLATGNTKKGGRG